MSDAHLTTLRHPSDPHDLSTLLHDAKQVRARARQVLCEAKELQLALERTRQRSREISRYRPRPASAPPPAINTRNSIADLLQT